MSLVAYGSSDESDAEDSPKSLGAGGRSAGLFASLPAPKNPSAEGPRDAGANVPQPRDVPQISGATQLTAVPNSSQMSESKENEDTLSLGFPPSRGMLSQESSTGLLLNLPKPKKRTEPVKITIPEIQRGDVSMKKSDNIHSFSISARFSFNHTGCWPKYLGGIHNYWMIAVTMLVINL